MHKTVLISYALKTNNAKFIYAPKYPEIEVESLRSNIKEVEE